MISNNRLYQGLIPNHKIRNLIQGTVSDKNLDSKSKLFDEASVVFGLFIGYLLNDSTKYQVDEYYSLPYAYIGIQLRALTAILGTFCMVISSFINYSIEEVMSIDIPRDSDESEQLRRNSIYKFLHTLYYIQLTLHLSSYICLINFIICFCTSLYSIYHKYLHFSIFFCTIILFSVFLIGTITFISIKKQFTISYVKRL